MSAPPPSIIPGAALAGVGIALLLGGLLWMSVIGYYDHQLPIIIGMLVVGGVMAFFGQRLYERAKRIRAKEAIRRRDSEQA